MYLEFFKQSFRKCTVYRANTFIRILTSFVLLFVSVSIWTALYRGKESVDGVAFSQMITYLHLIRLLRELTHVDVCGYNGKLNNTIIIPKNWVEESTKPCLLTYKNIGFYGHHWWVSFLKIKENIEEPYCFALGLFGQYIIIIPKY